MCFNSQYIGYAARIPTKVHGVYDLISYSYSACGSMVLETSLIVPKAPLGPQFHVANGVTIRLELNMKQTRVQTRK